LNENDKTYIGLEARTDLNDYDNNKNLALRVSLLNGFSNDAITTDMNGLSFNKRARLPFGRVPIQGQFYPMSAGAYLENTFENENAENPIKFLGITTQQPLGCASLEPAQFDIILDRRLNQDDNRGLGQTIKDNKFSVLRFNLHIERDLETIESKFQEKMFESSFKILRPIMKFFSFDSTLPKHPSSSILKPNHPLSKCQLEIAGIFLPTFFDEYKESENFLPKHSKLQLLLKSYKSRSSCENSVCKYDNLRFEEIFVRGDGGGEELNKITMEPMNFMGNNLSKISDTSPIQAYNLEGG